ncbi:MAG: cation:proton antiporter [Bacillota bacterium]|nr:cation:proton antiporter [Bacillota bacterium]
MFLENLNINANTTTILSISIILIAAFLLTRLTKPLKLPNVTGYILAGILIGPYALDLIPANVSQGMEFLTDLALAFIAFGVGRFLELTNIKQNGRQVLIITLFESLFAAVLISLSMYYIFKVELPLALLLGAIASATAPASTIMTIRQYDAKGSFVNMILQVVALDNVVALIAFSACAAVVQNLNGDGGMGASVIITPIITNIAAIGLGILAGFVLNLLITDKRSEDNRLLIPVAMISLVTGFCAAFDISPLLACMAFGTCYINISDNKRLFNQISTFAPPIMTMFFVLSGMRLDVPALKTAGIIGVAYFFIRIIGKYLGAYTGASISGANPEVRKYFGLTLVPQAGVSIGLAILGQRLLPPKMGSMLSTIILSSAVLYEMVGPASAKLGLYLAGAISHQEAKPKEAN